MFLALVRSSLPAALLLSAITLAACSNDSEPTAPSAAATARLSKSAGQSVTWEPEPGLTVTMQTLGELVADGSSDAHGVNDNGVVVGEARALSPERVAAFMWTQADGMQMISAADWTITRARDINDDGVVVGTGYDNGQPKGFRWNGSAMVPLESGWPVCGATANALNSAGLTVGGRNPRSYCGSSLQDALRWGPTSTSPFELGGGVVATDINDHSNATGSDLGSEAVWWDIAALGPGALIHPIPLLPGDRHNAAEGINSLDQMVGWSSGGTQGKRGFVYDKEAADAAKRLIALPALDGNSAEAYDINDNGLVVGQSATAGGFHATLWRRDMPSAPVDLHPPAGLYPGISSSVARAVNNNGVIAGRIWRGGSLAVVWTVGGGEPATPEEQIQGVIDDIDTVVQENPDSPAADKLEDVNAKLETALAELEKDPPDNQAALGNVEGAVGDLEAAVKDGFLDAAGGSDLMDRLAEAARDLAVGAVDDAKDRAGDQEVIDEAEGYLAEGDDLRDLGYFKDAVAKYKDALAKAESA
jgi:probable HAF family extracellular repeat protein